MHQLKIIITGYAGAGKTTLAHTIHEQLCASLPKGFTVTLDPSVEEPHDLAHSLAGLAASGTEIVIVEQQTRRLAARRDEQEPYRTHEEP